MDSCVVACQFLNGAIFVWHMGVIVQIMQFRRLNVEKKLPEIWDPIMQVAAAAIDISARINPRFPSDSVVTRSHF